MTDNQIEQIVNGWTQVQKIAVRQLLDMYEEAGIGEKIAIHRMLNGEAKLRKVQQLLNKTDEEEG